MRSRMFLGVGFLLLTTMFGCDSEAPFGCRGIFFAPSQRRVGQRAPDFSLRLLENQSQKVVLSEVSKEHPVLLVFWATWCPSCLSEIPILNEWHEKYRTQGLRILAVNVQEPYSQVLDFIKRNPIRYPALADEDGEVAARFGLVGLPSSVFLAKGGEIIYYGFGLPDNMEQLLAQS